MMSSLNRLFQAVVQLRLPLRTPLNCSSTVPFHRTGINEGISLILFLEKFINAYLIGNASCVTANSVVAQ
jgi:hypothetical protein